MNFLKLLPADAVAIAAAVVVNVVANPFVANAFVAAIAAALNSHLWMTMMVIASAMLHIHNSLNALSLAS